jgi:hypothetical protein
MSHKSPRIINRISDEFLEIRPEPFMPYLFIETKVKFPTSIAMAAVCGNSMKYINLRGATVGKLPKVQAIAREHFAETKGVLALYGPITEFLFVTSPTEAIRLTTTGETIGGLTGKFWPQSISIQREE